MIYFIATIISWIITFYVGFYVMAIIANSIGGIFNLITGAVQKNDAHR